MLIFYLNCKERKMILHQEYPIRMPSTISILEKLTKIMIWDMPGIIYSKWIRADNNYKGAPKFYIYRPDAKHPKYFQPSLKKYFCIFISYKSNKSYEYTSRH